MTAAAAPALRTLVAAARKEWQIIRRYTGLWIQLLFWPLALPLVYVVQANAYSGGDPSALAAFAARAGTSDLAGFLFVGWSVYMWLSTVLWGPGTQLRQQQVQGQLEAVFLTPASRPAILFGPMAAYLVLTLWQLLIVGLALRFGFGVRLGAGEAARALAVVAVSIPALYGLGALFSAAVLRFREVNGLVQVVRGVCTVFCGMTYPIVILPGWAQHVAHSLPPTYVIADFREVLLRSAGLVQLLPDFAVLLASGAVLCLAAAIAFAASERHARRGGALVQY
jgi:ABC-2 type transport system permease protein